MNGLLAETLIFNKLTTELQHGLYIVIKVLNSSLKTKCQMHMTGTLIKQVNKSKC